MDNKFDAFFKEHDFDIIDLHQGHEGRFLKKLHKTNSRTQLSWKWMGVAASITLLIGFYLGSMIQQDHNDLSTISPKMAEAQSFFISTINQELKEIEKFRTIETETMIEDALDEIENLEDTYKVFRKELKFNGNERHAIQGMINNYQQRLDVLEKLLIQLELQNNPEQLNDTYDEII